MATFTTKSFYITSSGVQQLTNGNIWVYMWDGNNPIISSANLTPRITGVGWTVGKTASASYCMWTASTLVAAANFATTNQPAGTTPGIGSHGWVLGPLNGVFAAGTWSISCSFWGTVISSQRGHMQNRVWKLPFTTVNSPGTWVQIFPGTIKTSILAVSASGGTTTITTGSFILTSSLQMQNEYMLFELAWAIDTAGGSNTADVQIVCGSGSLLRTSQFEDNTWIITSDDDNPGWRGP